jgi:hypothetical protein
MPLAVAGMIQRYRSDYPIMAYMVMTFFLYVIWPPKQGLRFLFPLLPFYLSFAISGLETFQGGKTALEKGLRKLVCYVPAVVVVLCFGFHAVIGAYENIRRDRVPTSPGPFMATSERLFSFISEQTEADSTVIFFKPRVMSLMTNHKSIMIKRVEELPRGDYLCMYMRPDAYHQVPDTAVDDLVKEGVANLVYENRDFRLYRLSEIWKMARGHDGPISKPNDLNMVVDGPSAFNH